MSLDAAIIQTVQSMPQSQITSYESIAHILSETA